MRAIVLGVLLASAAALAGCTAGKDAGDGGAGATPKQGELADFHGYVFDPAIRPLEGATVKVLDTNSSTLTNAEGYFGFNGLPIEQFLVVVATMDGYMPGSKQVTLIEGTPTRLNFSLEPQPVKMAATEVKEFQGILACQVEVSLSDQAQHHDCGGQLDERDRWEFSVGPDLAGAVIEVKWNPQNPAAESLGARLETLELGKLNLVLGDLVGSSPLRVVIPQSVAEKYYKEGGLLRLTVFARSNGDEVESGVGASVALQQTFNAYASLCYVQPPHAAYSFVGGSRTCSQGV